VGRAKPPEPRYALVTTPIAHLQAHPDHQSELVSQRLHGDVLRVEARRGHWFRVSGWDRYPGWVRSWSLRFVSATRARAWAMAANGWVQEHTAVIRAAAGSDSREGQGEALAHLPLGARLRPLTRLPAKAKPRGRLLRVELADGRRGVLRESDLRLWRPPAPNPEWGGAEAAASALTLKGTPYLWGGTSSWGVDCSGLVQLAYALAGIALPRDAQDQIRVARRLRPGETARAGDLLFFARNGDVNHVAMVTAPPRFVHAYGKVEEAAFDGDLRTVSRPELAPICLGVHRLRGRR
jgi:gamma-D-glutamyl-L-lysine dipeptidyl-peptidase